MPIFSRKWCNSKVYLYILFVSVGWMDWLVEWSHACAVLLSGRAADLGWQSWAGRAADLGCRVELAKLQSCTAGWLTILDD